MKVRRTFIAAGTAILAAAGFAAAAPTAQGAPNSSYTCNGELPTNTYGSVWVPEWCVVPDGADVTVTHGISVGSGAFFDASTHSTLTVHGNVSGGPGSFVALGCTEAHTCDDGEAGNIGDVTIDGNVSLDHVYDAAINGVTIGGNLTSVGGGAGLAEDQFIPFSVKDDTIGGNISVSGLRTTWFGVIRSQIGGNVTLTDIVLADPDGNEIVANTISRNLVCSGLSPAPQLGDAVEGAPPGYGPNDVGGKAVGQCVGLTS
jgi:hypothetical protein